jgi:hypothetical protein
MPATPVTPLEVKLAERPLTPEPLNDLPCMPSLFAEKPITPGWVPAVPRTPAWSTLGTKMLSSSWP